MSSNSLSQASSSYLRSAMHQPIHGFEWGEEAFAAAKSGNKPILLDIGAVWCHWCHVMDRESYEDPELAAIVNEHFVAVKVDRDERPDIDARYQAAVSAISGQGGWPLTGFLTPDGRPFFGGTYFPPDDRYGRRSFKKVLLALAQAYREKPEEVLEQAASVTSAITQAETFAGRSGTVSAHAVNAILTSARKMFDSQNGGFGHAPKFPHPAALDLLADHYARSGNKEIESMVVTTLERMAEGGMYDQLAGGFHRYSVDERWAVPHFEKMSYDNSELLKNYVHAYQATGNEFFSFIARDIIRWMNDWLTAGTAGGFYASQDADYSLDDDGDYFTWTKAEAEAVLSADEASVAGMYFGIKEVGEMHHNPAKNVLHVTAKVGDIASRLKIPEPEVEGLLESAESKMLAARLKRPTPFVDKTIYAGWNALCVSAYLEAAKVLSLNPVRSFALVSLDRQLAEAWQSERGLLHVIAYSDLWAKPRAIPGVLDDYAFSAIACLDAYEATGEFRYFEFAKSITDLMIAKFFDPVSGGFFDTEQQDEAAALGVLATRRKPFQDSPTPAGNSAAAIALLRLHAYTGEAEYRDKAEETLEAIAGVVEQYGIFAATWGIAAQHYLQPHTQVVVVGKDELAGALYAAAVASLDLNKAVIKYESGEENLPPALAESIGNLPELKLGKSLAMVCSGFTCQPPIYDAERLGQFLRAAQKAAGN